MVETTTRQFIGSIENEYNKMDLEYFTNLKLLVYPDIKDPDYKLKCILLYNNGGSKIISKNTNKGSLIALFTFTLFGLIVLIPLTFVIGLKAKKKNFKTLILFIILLLCNIFTIITLVIIGKNIFKTETITSYSLFVNGYPKKFLPIVLGILSITFSSILSFVSVFTRLALIK